MMGNAVQCAVWCESQYDGEATSGGYWAEGQTGFVTILIMILEITDTDYYVQ